MVTVPFRLQDNRIVVEALIDGRGPFHLIVDTGAPNVLTPEAVRRLGRETAAGDSTAGAGEKRVAMGSVHVASLRLGAFELRDQDVRVVDLGEIRRLCRFPHLDGIVGYELMEHAHVSVDFDRSVLRLREPTRDSTAAPEGAAHLWNEDGSPVIEARLDGVTGRMLVDTGDRSTLTVFRLFAASSGLEARFAKSPEITTGVGVGGPIPGRLATFRRVRFGSVDEHGVVARLPSTRTGLFATSPLAGSIGTGLLRNYNLEIDYATRSIAFTPRRGARVEPRFVPLPGTP
jgi:hypothetical protein